MERLTTWTDLDDDATLVAVARRGDRAALGVLLVRHSPLLQALCRRSLRDPELAEDAAQEAALRALLELDRLERPDRFGPWLGRIGLNVCRRLRRQRLRAADAWSLDTLPEQPAFAPRHPLDWHRRRVPNRVVFGYVLAALVHGSGYERIARPGCSDRTIRRRALPCTATCTTSVLEDLPPMAASLTPAPAAGAPLEVRVFGVARNPANDRRVVLLEEVGGHRSVPIGIGHFESDAIALLHQQLEMVRPLTHAFAARLVAAASARLRAVRVERLADETFYAVVVIEDADGATHEVDARPSDGIALALEAGVPLYVQPQVFDALKAV